MKNHTVVLLLLLSLGMMMLSAKAEEPTRSSRVTAFIKEVSRTLRDNHGNVTSTVEAFRKDFDTLNDGTLGATLEAWVEVRTMDLLASIEHMHDMQEVIDGFLVV